jgi:hypothetical protein
LKAIHAARALAAALLLATTTASAQPSPGPEKAAAQALFDEAQALGKDGKWEAACPKYAESLRLDPAMGTRFYLAQCLENTGKLASAWTYYLEVADGARAAGQKKREEAATERAEALKPRLPRLAIKVPEALRALAGLEIKRDGVVVGEAQWGTGIPVDPGKHALTASAPGKKPWSTEIELKQEGQSVDVEIPALASNAPPPPPPPPVVVQPRLPPPPPPPPPPPGMAGRRVAGFVVGGAGVVGLGVAFGLGGAALGKKSASNEGGCNAATDVCNAAGQALRSQGLGLATGSTVAFVVGLAAVGTGVVLVATAPAKKPAAPSVAAGPGGGSLTWRW